MSDLRLESHPVTKCDRYDTLSEYLPGSIFELIYCKTTNISEDLICCI